jgi:hypothetical protein
MLVEDEVDHDQRDDQPEDLVRERREVELRHADGAAIRRHPLRMGACDVAASLAMKRPPGTGLHRGPRMQARPRP